MIVILTQCFPPRPGGIETLMGGLAEALTAAGQEVVVYADGSRDLGAYDAGLPFAVKRFGGVKPLRRRSKARAAQKLVAGPRGPSISHVIADSWKSLEFVCLADAREKRPRIVCLAYGMELPVEPTAAKAARIRRSFAKADVVMAISRATAEMARPFLADAADLRVVTPPIPPQPQPRDDEMARLEARLHLQAGQRLIACLGRLEPRKGVDRLIDAVSRFPAGKVTPVLAVAGDGADRPRLEALADSLGVGDRVHFLGFVSEDEKAALLARADVFAMPVRRVGNSIEGFGLVYLEAAWYGTPSLAGRDGGAGDAVIDRVTGRLCDGADSASIAATLEAMLSDADALQHMGAAAQAHARTQLWSERVREFLV